MYVVMLLILGKQKLSFAIGLMTIKANIELSEEKKTEKLFHNFCHLDGHLGTDQNI